ncbi:MAG: carbon starvation protein A, partial [Deltaproteobacteria bacterium]|nr:carbon starvation protein A [Deltaproteobacteria bacterium]
MKLSHAVIAALSVLFAVAFGIIISAAGTGETVSALWLVVAAASFFLIIYRLYGAFIASRVLALDDRRKTPAMRSADGRDFFPTHTLVLFGHHFAAIA